MVRKLIAFPLRASARALQLWLRATGEAAGVALDAAGTLRRAVGGDKDRSANGAAAPEPGTSVEQPRPAAVSEPGTARRPSAAPGPSLVQEPAHVSEEPELVAELSEPGAEEGAGAEVHVHEPWEGYATCNAREVIARLSAASVAELAAVQMYETGHRGRQTILAAVDREMRSANGSGSTRTERKR